MIVYKSYNVQRQDYYFLKYIILLDSCQDAALQRQTQLTLVMKKAILNKIQVWGLTNYDY